MHIETKRGQAGQTYIKRRNLAIPHDEITNIGQHAAHEDMGVDGDALGPDGSALLGRFLGVVFQGDGRRFSIFDGRVGFVAAVGPVRGDEGGGWFGGGGVTFLERRVGFRALHPLEFFMFSGLMTCNVSFSVSVPLSTITFFFLIGMQIVNALTGGTLWVLGLVFDNAGDMRWAIVFAIFSTLD